MAINLGAIQTDQKYEFPVFKEVVATFTPTKKLVLELDGGDVKVYKDPGHLQMLSKSGPTPEMRFSGFGNGGRYTFEVEAGKSYYFWSGAQGCMNTKYIFLKPLDNLQLLKITPPDGSTFEIAGYGASDIDFNQPVSFESAFITCESKTAPVSPHTTLSSISVDMKKQLWNFYKDGTIKGKGQKFTLTIKGIKTESSALYNGDGTLVVNYLTEQTPISLINTKLPSTFISFFEPGDSNCIAVLTFSGPINPNSPKGKLFYGSSEAGDYYQEQLNLKIEGNTISIDFSGKSRKPRDMLRSGNSYPTIAFEIANVRDTNNNIAWSDNPGSVGGFTFNIPYQP